MLSACFLSLGLYLLAEAKTNVTVGWSDTSGYLSYYPIVKGSSDPTLTWLGNGTTLANSKFAFTTNVDSSAAFLFQGE